MVSGQVPVRNDQQEVTGYQYHQADAQILAEVSTSYQDEMDLFYIKKDYDLVKKREVFLQVGPWRLTFGSIRNSYDYWTMEGYEKELFGNMSIIYTYPTVYFKCKYLPHSVSSGEGLLPDEGGLSPTERYKKECPELFKKYEIESK